MKEQHLIQDLINEKILFTHAHFHYLTTLREYMPGSNLYMREVHFVAAADPIKAVPISDIANKLFVSAGAVSQIAARLEKKGLIQRVKGEKDKRQIYVALTDKGKDLFEYHKSYDNAITKNVAKILSEKFTPEELQTILKYEKTFYHIFTTYHK